MTVLKLIWIIIQISILNTLQLLGKIVAFTRRYQGDLVFSAAIIAVFSSLAMPEEGKSVTQEIKLDSFYMKEKELYTPDYWERILPKERKYTALFESLQKEFGVLSPNFSVLYKDSVDMIGRIIYTDEFDVGRLIVNDPTIITPHWEVITYISDVSVANADTATGIKLSSLIRDPRALNYLSRDERIKRAVAVSKTVGCQPSVLLAQDALESNFGKSSLTKRTKNSGNIKCRCNWDNSLRKEHQRLGLCVQAYDKIEKSNDYYVVFSSKWTSWTKKGEILSKYRVVKEARNKNLSPYQWAEVFDKSPYATDNRYGSSLKRLITSNQLTKLDSAIVNNIKLISDNGQYVYYP